MTIWGIDEINWEIFPSFSEYLRQHGSWFTPRPRPKDLRKRPNQQCFSNASHLRRDRPDLSLTYCEGVALPASGIGWLYHAWCAHSDEQVVDVTWHEPGLAYFGVPVDAKTEAEILLATRTYGVLPELALTNR